MDARLVFAFFVLSVQRRRSWPHGIPRKSQASSNDPSTMCENVDPNRSARVQRDIGT